MGACVCRKKDEHFSINDLNGMEKYYSLMSKRKADVFTWLIASEGPWEIPESFLYFKQIDAKYSPVKVLNEDEIRVRASNSKSSINSSGKQRSSLHVVQKEKQTTNLKAINSSLSNTTSIDANNETLLDWPSDW